MAYAKGKYPVEAASKIAHMEMIRDPALTEILQSLRSDEPGRLPSGCSRTGNVDLTQPHGIKTVVTVDGGLTVIPNPVRWEKRVAFIQVGTMLLSLADLEAIKADPFMDPRDLRTYLDRVDRQNLLLPLSGVRRPGRSIRDSNRELLNAILSPSWTNLYQVLEYLLWRGWLGSSAPSPKNEMHCLSANCRKLFNVPKAQMFSCPSCNADHYLSDYLGLSAESEDHGTEQLAMMVMATVELLALMRLPVEIVRRNEIKRLSDVLLVKDGPLMLRAQGSRLVDRVREFIEYLGEHGAGLHLIGIEKNGDFVDFINDFDELLTEPGDYFIPSRRFLVEDIQGGTFDPSTYRNRVSYGTRVGVRLSSTHVFALHVPTFDLKEGGPFEPRMADLMGFEEIVRTLSELTSSLYQNAALPLVLANQAVSLSNRPSSGILETYLMTTVGEQR